MEKRGQREQKNEMQNPRRWLAGMEEGQVIPESAPNLGPMADARSHHPPWMVLSLNLTEAALLGSLRSEAQDTGLGGQLWDPAPPPSPAMVPAQASHVHGCHLFDPGHELGTGKLALQLSSYLIITPALICWYYYSHFTAGKTDAQRG